MSILSKRNIEILKIIVEEYLNTGGVIGSKSLLKKYDLGVSSATVRNDMATLERLELVFQPYNSAGRLPTSKGLRVFVDYMMDKKPDHFLNEKNTAIRVDNIKKFEDLIHNITFDLSKNTGEISFFVIPGKSINKYIGIAPFLENNYKFLGDGIYNIIRMLEDKFNFMKFISSLSTNPGVNVFIGEENIIPYLKDYSIILREVNIDGETGYIGIIGGLKMDYSFNIAAIRGII